jgi:hypothetical protein
MMAAAPGVREAAELVLFMREELAEAPEDIMATLRREFPGLSLIAVFRELTAIQQQAGGNA